MLYLQSAYCKLQKELGYLKPTTLLSRSQKGVIKAPAGSCGCYKSQSLKSPWRPTVSSVHWFLLDTKFWLVWFRSSLIRLRKLQYGDKSKANQRKGKAHIYYEMPEYMVDTPNVEEKGRCVKEVKRNAWAHCSKWASKRQCYFLKDTKRLEQGRIETGSILASVGKELIWNRPKGQKYHDSHSCQSSS